MSQKLVVGGAQFGSYYGIANRGGVPRQQEVCDILRLARDAGVSWIDTARAYSGSEAAIGAALQEVGAWSVQIVTKLPPLGTLCKDMRSTEKVAAVHGELRKSQCLLHSTFLDTVLFHRYDDLALENGLIAEVLQKELQAGRIGAIGVSVQTPEELANVLTLDWIRHIQMPCNLLDHRWESIIPELRRVRSSRSLCVHARSLFLQGLLLSTQPVYWQRACVNRPAVILDWLQDQLGTFNRRDIPDLCLAWGRAKDWIDGLVIGTETSEQMAANLRTLQTSPLTPQEVACLENNRPHLALKTLDPAQWEKSP
jgi:aryl-alcohol dehydrogenase-like predicted oxidoreductase